MDGGGNDVTDDSKDADGEDAERSNGGRVSCDGCVRYTCGGIGGGEVDESDAGGDSGCVGTTGGYSGRRGESNGELKGDADDEDDIEARADEDGDGVVKFKSIGDKDSGVDAGVNEDAGRGDGMGCGGDAGDKREDDSSLGGKKELVILSASDIITFSLLR